MSTGFKDIEIAYRLKYEEVMCKDGTLAAPMHWTLLAAWEHLRRRLGVPIKVNSAFRTWTYNKSVGGSPTSQHLLGRALDLQCASVDLSDPGMIEVYLDCGFKGIGRGNLWVHLDTRDGDHSLWTYGAGGAIMPDLMGRAVLLDWRGRQ